MSHNQGKRYSIMQRLGRFFTAVRQVGVSRLLFVGTRLIFAFLYLALLLLFFAGLSRSFLEIT
jgi:hypothetical protein